MGRVHHGGWLCPPMYEGWEEGDQDHAEVDRENRMQDALGRGEAPGSILQHEIRQGDDDLDSQRYG